MICQRVHQAPPFAGIGPSELGVRIAGNGSYQIVAVCPDCATTSSPISHYVIGWLGVFIGDLPVVADYRGNLGRCSRRGCEREAVEDHHFAPRAVFGDEADDWPMALLCVDHHNEWHRRIEGAA